MIDPINPGPAGSAGPAGVSYAGPNPAAYSQAMAEGTGVIAGSVSTALNSISSALSDVLATIKDAMSRAAAAIATPTNLVQSTIDLSEATAQASIGSKLATLPVPTPPLGVGVPGQDKFYVIQSCAAPYTNRIYWQSPGGPGPDTRPGECIIGIFNTADDASALAHSRSGAQPPADCCVSVGVVVPSGPPAPPANGQPKLPPSPGGPSQPPTAPCPTGQYSAYFYTSGTSPPQYTCWFVVCSNDPIPPPPEGWYVQVYTNLTLEQAQMFLANQPAGCLAKPGPPIVSGPTGPVGPVEKPCPECPPCPPAPPTAPAPPCLMIDLCDWQKFEDALVNALCRWYEKCVCKLDNQTSYQITDCDNILGQNVDAWKGKIGAVATDNDVDGIIATGSGTVTTSDWSGTGTNPNPWS